jgi:hypothetical protein
VEALRILSHTGLFMEANIPDLSSRTFLQNKGRFSIIALSGFQKRKLKATITFKIAGFWDGTYREH